MKRTFLFLILFISLASCASQRLVKKSDVCVANAAETKIWFRDTDGGRYVYESWRAGIYGKAEVFLVDSAEFVSLVKKTNQ